MERSPLVFIDPSSNISFLCVSLLCPRERTVANACAVVCQPQLTLSQPDLFLVEMPSDDISIRNPRTCNVLLAASQIPAHL